MRKIVLHIILCLYFTALIKPVVPVVCDVVAHTFWKMQHLATVHYENGKYHLHVELQDSSEDASKKSSSITNYESLFVHIGINSSSEFLLDYSFSKYYEISNRFISSSLEKDILPPKA